jgi:hypothetical protein
MSLHVIFTTTDDDKMEAAIEKEFIEEEAEASGTEDMDQILESIDDIFDEEDELKETTPGESL